MLQRDLIDALSHIPEDEDVSIVIVADAGETFEDGDVLQIANVGFTTGMHVIRAEPLP